MADAGALRITVVAEQLRRAVPGGIGTYAKCLLGALAAWPSDDVEATIAASPYAGRGRDPLEAFGLPIANSGGPGLLATARVASAAGTGSAAALPTRLISRMWDRGLAPVGAGSEVVHATSVAAPPTRGAPLTVMVHDVAWRQAPDAFPARGLRWHEAALHRVARAASIVVVPSQAAADALAAATADIERSAIRVIRHGCDHMPPPDHDAATRILGSLDVTGPYLLSVSTLEPRKNLHRLVVAYARARQHFSEPWSLVVVGPSGWGAGGGRRDQVREHVAKTAGVVLAGSVDGACLRALYERAGIVAYVPLAEGFGLPAVEAMAAGAPVIASTGVPSAAELAPGCALVVDPLSLEALTDAIGGLADDPAKRAELGAAGRAAVVGRTWASSAEQHIAVWREVAESRPRAGI